MQIIRAAMTVAVHSILAYVLLCWLSVGHWIVMADPNSLHFHDFVLVVREAAANAKNMAWAGIYGFGALVLKTMFGTKLAN